MDYIIFAFGIINMKKTILLLLCVVTMAANAQLKTPFKNGPFAEKTKQEQKQAATRTTAANDPVPYDPYKNLNYESITFPYSLDNACSASNSTLIDGYERVMGFTFTLTNGAYISFQSSDGSVDFVLLDADKNPIESTFKAGTYYVRATRDRYYDEEGPCSITLNAVPLPCQTINLPYNETVDFTDANTANITIDHGNNIKVKLFRFTLSAKSVFSCFSDYAHFTLFDENLKQIRASLDMTMLEAGTYYMYAITAEDIISSMIDIYTFAPTYTTITLPHTQNLTFRTSDMLLMDNMYVKTFQFTLNSAEYISIKGSADNAGFLLFNDAMTVTESDTSIETLLPKGTYNLWVYGELNTTATVTIKTESFFNDISLPHTTTLPSKSYTTSEIYYRFTVTEHTLFELSAQPDRNEGYYELELYDAGMSQLTYSGGYYYGENYEAYLSGALTPRTYIARVSDNNHSENDCSLALNFRTVAYTPITSFGSIPFSYTTANSVRHNSDVITGFTFTISKKRSFQFGIDSSSYGLPLYDATGNIVADIYRDDTRIITLEAGTYYLHPTRYYGNGTQGELKIRELVYEEINLPYSQAHTYDENTIMQYSSRIKAFSFTLSQSSFVNISDSEREIEFYLYDENMEEFDHYTMEPLPAGKYYVWASYYVYGGNDMTTTININTVSFNHVAINIPYTQQHTFSASNTVEFSGLWLKAFSFTLTAKQNLLFSSSEIYTVFLLYDANDNSITGIEMSGARELEAGTYRLFVGTYSEYAEYFGRDMTAEISIAAAPEINYEQITLPYSQSHTFSNGNTMLIGGAKTKFFTFIKTDEEYTNISANTFGAFFVLYRSSDDDGELYVHDAGYSVSASYEGVYYLWVSDRYYKGAGDMSSTISAKNLEYTPIAIPFNQTITLNERHKGYSFTLAEPQEIRITYTAPNNDLSDTEVSLMEGDDYYQYIDNNYTATLSAGTYYVRISTWNRIAYENQSDFFTGTLSIGEKTVGVEEVGQPNVKVYAANGEIVIAGIDMPYVEVYDISGRLIVKDNANRIAISNAGAYIVKVNNRIEKVMVR